jgi:hypothetical protein
MSRFDLKTLVIGILLGICVMMARGNEPVQTAFIPRYQISVVPGPSKGDGYQIFVLDQKTNKVYESGAGSMNQTPVLEIKTSD